MKFSDIEEKSWDELKPYLDTCLLPVTGLTGQESPWEAVRELERLRDALDLLEIPFKGRVVTYPAMHFTGTEEDSGGNGLLNQICMKLKADAGFRYVVIVTAKPEEELASHAPNADLVLRFGADELNDSRGEAKRRAAAEITLLWQQRTAEQTDV